MANKNNKEANPFEKQLEEINEWQRNATNPGYFIGSGKVPLPLRNPLKSPVVMLVAGVVLGLPVIYNLITGFSMESIMGNLMGIGVSGILIAGGIIRLMKKN